MRYSCPDCQGPVISKSICKMCLTTHVSGKRYLLGVCAKCDPEAAKIIRTEVVMREMIIDIIKFPPSLIDRSIIGKSCQG